MIDRNSLRNADERKRIVSLCERGDRSWFSHDSAAGFEPQTKETARAKEALLKSSSQADKSTLAGGVSAEDLKTRQTGVHCIWFQNSICVFLQIHTVYWFTQKAPTPGTMNTTHQSSILPLPATFKKRFSPVPAVYKIFTCYCP